MHQISPQAARAATTSLSIVVPIYNEEGSIKELCERLFAVLEGLDLNYEVLCVDDGSRDASLERLREEVALRPRLRVLSLTRNHGQTAALMAGIDSARNEVIVSLDADLQNDPVDIPRLIAKLDEGYDVVSGWRKDRQDSKITRNFVSRLANRLISRVSGVPLHDYGCTLKAYRRDVIKDVRLFGEMHRFIPIYATWLGARVVEMPVLHHPRKHGVSKYGLERTAKVVLDLVVVKFLDRHFVKPIYVFGGFGLFSLALSGLGLLWMLWLKIVDSISMIQTPLPVFVAMTFLVGIMSILMGLLAEMLLRTYFDTQSRPAYRIREEFGGAHQSDPRL